MLGRDPQDIARNEGIAAREVVAVPAVDRDARAVAMYLDAKAVEFDFVSPAEPGGRLLAQCRQTRCDEGLRTLHCYFLLPPLMTRSGVFGTSGGRVGGSRSG